MPSERKICILIFGFIWLLGFCFWSWPAGGMGSPVPRPQQTGWLIDDFEDGNVAFNPEWWVFGRVSPEVIGTVGLREGEAAVIREIGNFSLLLKGSSQADWYAGGMGCYIAKPGQNLSVFRNMQMDLYGYGPGQGTLKIELYDDDNRNWELEQNTLEAYAPLYDDRFSTDLRVDWFGWKRIVIPFTVFKDDNPSVGDDWWNPTPQNGSGGLLQIQFVAISSQKIGSLRYAVDNIRLTK